MDRGQFMNSIGFHCAFSLRSDWKWASGDGPNVRFELRGLLCETLLLAPTIEAV